MQIKHVFIFTWLVLLPVSYTHLDVYKRQTAAGAPFLPKLVQGAKGNVAFGVGLMVLLMVVTIGYMPLVLPFLLPGVQVNPWDIAQSLIVLMRCV